MSSPLALLLGLALAGSPGVSTPDRADLARELAAARRASERVTPGSPEAKPVASELARIGRAYLDRGESGRALELLQEAYGLDEENGLVLAQLTLTYVHAEDFPFARFYLDLAEQRAPHAPPEVYAVLGESYYALNRLEDAVLAWEHYGRLGGTDSRILDRLARTRQELAFSSKQKFLETEDFAFFFDAAIPRETVDRAAAELSRSYRDQAALYGTRLPTTQVVVLYAGRSYFTLVSVPEWVSGVFDGKIRVAVAPDGGFTPQLSAVLCHELAHALIRHASRDRAPGWLHEGLAQWWEGKRVARAEFRELFRASKTHSLAEMEGRLARKTDRTAARTHYIESLGVIEYVIQTRGSGALVCVIRDLSDGLATEEALVRETGFTSDELVTRWKAWAGL